MTLSSRNADTADMKGPTLTIGANTTDTGRPMSKEIAMSP